MFDSISYVMAMFFGSWYGIWLGMHWYAIVYEAGRRGLFHAFLGRLAGNNSVANTPVAKTPIMTRPQPSPKQAASARPSQPRKASWEFEDLAKLRPVTPRPARMTTDEQGTWTKKVSVKPAAAKRSVKKAAPTSAPAKLPSTPAKAVVNQNSRRKVVSKTAIKQVL